MEQSHDDVPLKDNISAAITNDVEQCLNAFDTHLESERGCAPDTRAHYLREAGCFLVDVFRDLRTNWKGLNADHVAGFVLRCAEKLADGGGNWCAVGEDCFQEAIPPPEGDFHRCR
jgi:hypothetical protein